MAEATDWSLCILCQKDTTEGLVCPLLNPVNVRREGAYADIINLVTQFRAVDAAPLIQTLNFQMKHQCTEIMHPGTSHVVNCTRHQCWTVQDNVIPKDYLQQGKNLGEAAQTIVETSVFSVVVKHT